MIQKLLNIKYARQASSWTQEWLIPTMLRRRTFGAALVASLLVAFYWGLIASDRYVSEAHIIIEKTNLSSGQSMDFGSLLGNGGGNHADQMLMRDYLLSIDILKILDAKLNLRAHYSDGRRDPLSRMWFKDTSIEQFYSHFLKRVSVEYDSYAGVLVIKAQAYDSITAQAVAVALVDEGERKMNSMAHSLAKDQVGFLEKQVSDMGERVIQTRQTVLNYQNEKGMVSPQGTVENLAAIINRLEAQLTDLQTRRSALLGYLMSDSPNVVELNHQIAAVEKQIKREQARLVSTSGQVLNSTVEEFQRLQMNAEFAQDVYKTALVALESGRVEASRTLKKVLVLQQPSRAEYPLEPRRLYNTVVFILVTLLLMGIVHLLVAIIRDHKD